MCFGTVYGLAESVFKRLSTYGVTFNISHGQALFFRYMDSKVFTRWYNPIYVSNWLHPETGQTHKEGAEK